MSKELTLFKDFFNNLPSFSDIEEDFASLMPADIRKVMNGKCDFEETDSEYSIELELPGVKKDEVNVDLKNDILTVSWKREREQKKGLLKNKRYERSTGSFTRSFSVSGADSSKVDASLSDGVLKVKVGKNDAYKAKKIEIK